MSFCGKCGNELEVGVKFCGKCGQAVNAENKETLKASINEENNINFDENNEIINNLQNENTKNEEEVLSGSEENEKNLNYKIDNNEEQQESQQENDIKLERDTEQEILSSSEVDNSTDDQPQVIKRRISKKGIIVSIIIGVICISLGVFWYIGSTMTKPIKLVEAFDKAVASDDKKAVSSLMYCSDSKLQLSEDSMEPLLAYFKDNPSYSKNIIENLKKEAVSLETNKNLASLIGNNSSSVFSIVEAGKEFLFFPKYKISMKPVYIDISTAVKDVTFILNNKEIGKSDIDKFSKEFGPFVPGKYELASTYAGKYVSLDEKKNINCINSNDEKIKISVFDNLSYVKVTSDYSNAEIYVNDKNTGIKVSDAQDFGPLSKGTKVYGVVSKNGKSIKSSMYSVSEGEKSIYLDFAKAENEIINIENQLHSLIDDYTYHFTSAVNYDEFYYVEPYLYPGSDIYNMQKSYISDTYKKGIKEQIKSFKVLSYTISDDNSSGTINTEEIYEIYDKSGKSSIKTFNYKYEFKYNDSKKYYQLSSISSGNS